MRSDGSKSPTSIFTPREKISAISSMPCRSTYSSNTSRIASAMIASSTCRSDIWWLDIMSSSSLPSDDDARVPQIADPRHGGAFAEHGRPLPGTGDHGAVVGDAQPGADARLLVDVLRPAGDNADLLDDLAHEIGNLDGELAVEIDRPPPARVISMPRSRSRG